MNEQMNAVIYARFSSSKQHEQSIDGQIRYCTEYANRCGYKIVDTYIDRAISGTSDNRPDFQRMIKDAEKRNFQYIIVWKLDRFARNRYDSAIYKAKLKKYGVKVLSATEGIGEGTESIILEAVLESMAEIYSKQLSENVKRGMKESALKANSTGGSIPFGYILKEGKLVVDEKNAEAVRLIYKMYANGVSKKEIADILNSKGYRTSTNHKWTINSFARLLKNKKYIGIFMFDDIEVPGGCPAIIEEELFNKVQIRCATNKRSPKRINNDVSYLLKGKLFCGYCGSPMVGDSATSGSGKKHYYYSCAERKKHGTCKKHREKKDFIEWYVVEQTVEYILTPSRIKYISEKVVEKYNEEYSNSTLAQLEKRHAELDREYEKLTDKLINTTSQRIINKINSRAEELELIISEIEENIAEQRIASEVRINVADIEKWLKEFCTGDLFEMEFRQRIIDVLVNSIYLYDDKVVIYYNVREGQQTSLIEPLSEPDFDCSETVCNGSPLKNLLKSDIQ